MPVTTLIQKHRRLTYKTYKLILRILHTIKKLHFATENFLVLSINQKITQSRLFIQPQRPSETKHSILC